MNQMNSQQKNNELVCDDQHASEQFVDGISAQETTVGAIKGLCVEDNNNNNFYLGVRKLMIN